MGPGPGKGRGRGWRGLRDWFRPVENAPPVSPEGARVARRELTEARGATGQRPWTRDPFGAATSPDVALLSSEGSAGEAILELGADDAIDEKELLEFLASDLDPVPADPVFRERLREELWEVVLKEGVGPEKDV